MNKPIIAMTLLAVALLGATAFIVSHQAELADGQCTQVTKQGSNYFVTNTCPHNLKITISQPGVDYDKTFVSDCLSPKKGQATNLVSSRSYKFVSEEVC